MKATLEVLRYRCERDLEGDIQANYDRDIVLLHINGTEHGHVGIRKSGTRLESQLPDFTFHFKSCQVDGPYAYLEWEANSKNTWYVMARIPSLSEMVGLSCKPRITSLLSRTNTGIKENSAA